VDGHGGRTISLRRRKVGLFVSSAVGHFSIANFY
jgi:hypothetical protein